MTALLLPALLATASPESQFDFWLGQWDLKIATRTDPRKEDWTKGTAKNVIEKVLDGKVVQESFVGPGLVGKSWSVYDPKAKKWKQTWVDATGGYIALQGEFNDGKMTLYTLPEEGKREYRMVFSEIKPDSLRWTWEVKRLDGQWAATFICDYTRSPKA